MGVQKVLIVSKKEKGRRPLEETKTSKERRKELKIGNFKRTYFLNNTFEWPLQHDEKIAKDLLLS